MNEEISVKDTIKYAGINNLSGEELERRVKEIERRNNLSQKEVDRRVKNNIPTVEVIYIKRGDIKYASRNDLSQKELERKVNELEGRKDREENRL